MATETTKRVDHLDEDIVHCGDLRYALISFVTKDGKQRLDAGDKLGLKIRGAFATKPEADAYIKKLMKSDNLFDVYLVDMYKWLLLPAPENIDDVQYQETYLNTMISEYKESQALAKQHFNERKQRIMEEGLDKHLNDDEKLPPLEELEKDVHASSSSSAV
jgi:hypothetical protein